MKRLLLYLCLILVSGCTMPFITTYDYEIKEIREVAPGFTLVKTHSAFTGPGYVAVQPGFVCESDTSIQLLSRKSVESFFHNDSLIVLKESGRSQVEVFRYDADESFWRHVSNNRAQKDSLIRRSGRELEYPPMNPVEEAKKITLNEFLEYPGWKSCD